MNTSTMSERLITYIWSCEMNTSHSHIRMALHLYMIMWDEHIPQSHQNGSALISDHVRWKHPIVTLEWLCTYILPWDEHINHVRKAHRLITSLWREPRSGEHQDKIKLEWIRLIINLGDLDMLRLVMEHWVLWQLHTILVVIVYASSIQQEIKQIR